MSTHSEKNWEGFWLNTSEPAAYRGGAPQEEVLNRFWCRFFSTALPEQAPVDLLDIACGNGIVSAIALQIMEEKKLPQSAVFGLDQSLSALKSLAARSSHVRGVLANAAVPPFRRGVFHLVVSQFGLEYAGLDAFGNVGGLLRPGGVFAAVIHLKEGAMFRECRVNRTAVLALDETGFFKHSRAVFLPGRSTVAARRGLEQFQQALSGVDGILQAHGTGVAGGTVKRLRADVLRMYQNRSAYSREEVINWIGGMRKELLAYAGRMSAMLDAAMDEQDMQALEKLLAAGGLRLEVREPMNASVTGENVAWALVAEKSDKAK